MESIYQIPPKFSNDIEQKNFWLKVVTDQKASGLSIKKFCEQHQISFSTFSYWKYRKNKPSSNISNNISKAKNKQVDKDIAKFIPLQVMTDVPSAKSHQEEGMGTQGRDREIEIAFKNGHKIILPLVISDAHLLLLIKAVGGL